MKRISILFSFLIFTFSLSTAQTIGQLWGMTPAGGDSGGGILFNYDPITNYDSVVHQFVVPGQAPYGTPIQASDGNFYGMTYQGGTYGAGIIYKCTPLGRITILHYFKGGSTDGKNPYGDLLQASDGNLYGMTYAGGSSNFGTLFKCTTAGTFTLLHTFKGGASDGIYPYYGGLIQATDGNFYGMTQYGGAFSHGIIFKCTTSGALTVVHSFARGATDGEYSEGSIIQASDGNLYGMTFQGGASNYGTIFKCTISGTLTELHSFIGGVTDGMYPEGKLMQASDGNLYGMAVAGGSSNDGIIFKCTTAGTMTLLHNFTGGSSDGANPYGGLIQATDGNLYGETSGGGASNNGIVFKCTTAGAVTVLHTLAGRPTDGSSPIGNLIQGIDGNLYGTTLNGGATGYGCLFKCTTIGTENLLYSFVTSAIGDYPYSSELLQANDGNLYGTTAWGGTFNNGTIFKCDSSAIVSTISNFPGTNNNAPNPWSGIIQATDSNFYGATVNNGTYNLGYIFKITPSGISTILHNFSASTSDGDRGVSRPLQANDGYLYGMTQYGGSSGKGIIYKCSTAGVFTVIHNFTGGSSDGNQPLGHLIQASDGNLYGMTVQ